MKKRLLVFIAAVYQLALSAHCQMPCGIYDDQMIYDQVDQFYETMFKAVSALKNSNFSNVDEKNRFIRWVITKENQCNETAHTLMQYFLQQKIKPSTDEDTLEMIHVIHNLMFMLVQIKQSVDLDIVKEFGKEWEHFKYLFHPEMKCDHPTIKEPGWSPEDEKKEQEAEKRRDSKKNK